MKFETYRKLDLIILSILTFIIEIVATFCVNGFFHGIRPFPVVGMLMTLIAITRWGLIGSIIIPISVLANFICGRFFIVAINYRETYDLISIIISLVITSSILISFGWIKKFGVKDVFKDGINLFTMIGSAIVLSLFISVLFSSVNYFHNSVDDFTKDFTSRILGVFLYNCGSYIVLIVFTPLLAKQDVFIDVKKSLLDKKKEKQNEDVYYSKKQNDEKK